RAGGGVGGVVGHIGARHRNAANSYGFSSTHGGIGESGAGVAGGQAISRQAVIRQSDGGGSRAVINFVDPRGADHQRSSCNISGGAGGRVGGVVGRIGAAESDAADADGLGRADVLVGETGGGVGAREAVAGQTIISE